MNRWLGFSIRWMVKRSKLGQHPRLISESNLVNSRYYSVFIFLAISDFSPRKDWWRCIHNYMFGRKMQSWRRHGSVSWVKLQNGLQATIDQMVFIGDLGLGSYETVAYSSMGMGMLHLLRCSFGYCGGQYYYFYYS